MTEDDSNDRVAPFLERLARVSVDDLSVLALAAPDFAAHRALVDRVERAAHAAGRIDDLEEAAAAACEQIEVAFSRRGYDPTWFELNWGRSIGRSRDRAVLMLAVVDAAVSAVVRDLLTEDDVANLEGPFHLAVSMKGATWVPNVLERRRGRAAIMRSAWFLAAGLWFSGLVYLFTEFLARIIDARPRDTLF